jgi:hypothetical protein
MRNCILAVFVFLCIIVNAQIGTYQAFYPGQIWKDNNGVHINAHGGGILYYNNTYYWFGEHKIEGKAGNVAHVGVHVYSSKDLYNWIDEGVALSVVSDSTSDIVKGCIIERPKVIYNAKTKKFVMWFHLEKKGKGYSAALSGIAVASNPTGPYRYLRSVRSCPGFWPVNVQDFHKKPVSPKVMATYYPGGGFPEHPDSLNILGKFYKEGQMERDMTLFVDDNEKAYHIYASEYNSTIHIAELSDDYLSHTGKYVRAFVAQWTEAPAVFKRNDLYYFVGSGCTSWDPNAARSAVAPSIWGPWTETGNPCIGKDSALTFHSQSTYILPVAGKKNTYIFMADRWNPDNAIDGRYVWLPIKFKEGRMQIEWYDKWNLDNFE